MLARLAVLAVLAAGAAYGGEAAAGPMSPLAQYAADPDAPIRCQDGMVLVLKAADMAPACVGKETGQVLIERGWAVEAPAGMMAPAEAAAYPRDAERTKDYAKDAPGFGAEAVKSAVSEALAMYDESGDAALGAITASAETYDSSEPYVFVLELLEPPVVAAHGALPERVGAVSRSLTTAERPYSEIMEDLNSEGSTWVEYVFPNPATGSEQSKKSWMVLRGEYVFGSGYYVGSAGWEKAAAEAVSEALDMYDRSGEAALAAITASARGYDASAPYVFVLDERPTILAHGAFPDKVGTEVGPLLEADRPWPQILDELRGGEGAWAEYVFENPATGLEQSKKSWMVMRDGYIFGSGYYTESESQAVKRAVSEAVSLFEAHGESALSSITASAEGYDPSKPYVFVLDGSDEPMVLAHGAYPDRVGAVSTLLMEADRPYAQILEDVRDGGAWAEYTFMNPATETEQLKRSWLSMSGGYIFGSGYYLSGS